MSNNTQAQKLIENIENNLKALKNRCDEVSRYHTKDHKTYEYVFNLVHDVGKAADFLRESYDYLRKRKNENGEHDPAIIKYGKCIDYLNSVMERGCAYINGEYNKEEWDGNGKHIKKGERA